MKKQINNIDAYIAQFPNEIAELLERIRTTIHKAAPGAEEAVKWQMPTIMKHGNLVFFAAFKHHIGFFPMPSTIEAFKKELAEYKTSKGAIQFPYGKKIPYALVTKMVKFRVKELAAKQAAKNKKKP